MSNLLLILYALFMTVVFGVYFVVQKKHRYFVLLFASLLFFAVYSKFLTIFILLTITTVYFAGFGMNKLDEKLAKKFEENQFEKEEKKKLKAINKKKKKWILISAVVFNLAILGVLKYSGFFASIFEGFFACFGLNVNFPVLNILLPLGISYYTLTSIGYLIDVSRGKYKAETNPFKVALFISYFPQLFEGPFAKFDELTPQLVEGHDFDSKRVGSGLLLFVWGLFKKFVIADRLAIVAGEVFVNYSIYHGLMVVVGILFFTFQLYAEFSGLIDMASGISEMFGIRLAKNFNQPFYSQNVNEFWRRWHISLGTWFKEYIFYSVSMSKGMLKLNKKIHGKVKPFFELFIPSALALFVVWFSNGLWHGADAKYIVYGLYYYIIMMIGMCLEPLYNSAYGKLKLNKDAKIFQVMRIVRTFVFISLGMLIFRASTLSDAGLMFVQIFKTGCLNIVSTGVIDLYDFVLSFVCIIVLLVTDYLLEHNINIKEKILSKNYYIKFLIFVAMLVIILTFGAFGGEYVPPDPIYGGF